MMKTSLPTSLSLLTNQTFSSSSSLNNSPARTKYSENENSLVNVCPTFGQEQTNGFGKKRSIHRPLSSSTSSSSSIDEALMQMAQQSQPFGKRFNKEPTSSIFHFQPTQIVREDVQQEAVHENLEYLASIASISTPIPQTESSWISTVDSETIRSLNEICDRGFDELNTLIQEQRLIQSHLNVNLSSNLTMNNVHRSNSVPSKIFIIPEYYIFKCQKVNLNASQIFEVLSVRRPELRLRDLMFAFQAWKESISKAEAVEKEEDLKLSLIIEHPQTYSMNDEIFQSAFERVSHALRELTNRTQRARAAFQYATLNIFQKVPRSAGASLTRHNGSSP